MKLKEIIHSLETWAPPQYQESYDNSGLICGNLEQSVTKAICTLDCTEAVIKEAIEQGVNLIIAHHPIVFSALKSLTGSSYIERTVIAAIQNNIAIYALHTNLDAIQTGVNGEIGNRLGLIDLKILAPKKSQLNKLYTYVPKAYSDAIRNALFEAGAGDIGNYDHCSYNVEGIGTFRAGDQSQPFVGEKNQDHNEEEVKIEVLVPKHLTHAVVSALHHSHPYETVAYEVISLENKLDTVGSGMIGRFAQPLSFDGFLRHVSDRFNTKILRYTKVMENDIETVAFCGGSGSFLLDQAKRIGADVFVSSDFKYHQFFDAEETISIIDIGHFEFEQFTPHLIQSFLAKKFPTFAVLLSGVKTNPVHYFIS